MADTPASAIMDATVFLPSAPGGRPACCDMIRTPECGSSAIAARITEAAARLSGGLPSMALQVTLGAGLLLFSVGRGSDREQILSIRPRKPGHVASHRPKRVKTRPLKVARIARKFATV